MSGKLAIHTAPRGGVFTRAQALASGYADEDLRALVRKGVWRRIRRGAYIDKAAYDSLDRVGRHRVLAHAVTLSLGDNVAISHASATVLHGLADWAIDLNRLHVTRFDNGAGRLGNDVHHHVGDLPATDLVEQDGLRLVRPVRAILETACTSAPESGLVVADHALRTGQVSSDELRTLAEGYRLWPGSRTACMIANLADGRSESVGESRARLLMHERGLPAPRLQHEIYDGPRFVARVDFYFEAYGVVVEFDGKVKYGGFGDDPAEVVFKEKRREDLLRELGYEIVRLIWSDLDDPYETAERIRRAFARASHRGPAASTSRNG